MKKRRNLLVTLADNNYLEQAKQLFSSVYHNSGWKGDYMLLAYEVPEEKLSWFREKGIIVKKCPPLDSKKRWKTHFPISVLSKFYLFTPYFKKWRKIIYLDVDIIVRSSLDNLIKIKGFAAGDNINFKMKNEFINMPNGKYNLEKKSFCSGVMSIDTDIILEKDFFKLIILYDKYGKYCTCGEQGILNLFLYDKWKKLPLIYNIAPNYLGGIIPRSPFKIKFDKLDGAIIHFLHFPKPWDKKSYYYQEWEASLKLSYRIKLETRKESPRKVRIYHHLNHHYHLNKDKSKFYLRKSCSNFLKCSEIVINEIKKFFNWMVKFFYWMVKFFNWIFFSIDKQIGLIGLSLKKRNPKLYNFLRRN